LSQFVSDFIDDGEGGFIFSEAAAHMARVAEKHVDQDEEGVDGKDDENPEVPGVGEEVIAQHFQDTVRPNGRVHVDGVRVAHGALVVVGPRALEARVMAFTAHARTTLESGQGADCLAGALPQEETRVTN